VKVDLIDALLGFGLPGFFLGVGLTLIIMHLLGYPDLSVLFK